MTPYLRILKKEQQKGTNEMKRVGRVGFICLLAALMLCQTVHATGEDVSSITLNQVRQKGSDLTMYVNLYDGAGFPVVGTYSPEQFVVSVDGVGASVDSVLSYDPSVQGIHYVFVVDISLSMTAAMMKNVRTALNAYVDKMGPNDTVTVISFGEQVTELLSESADKETIKDTISGIVPAQYWTALYESVIRAAKVASGGRSAVIVITDGKNVLPDGRTSPTKEDIMAQLQSAQVPLYCIGLNDNNGVNRNSLIELANATGGAEFDGPASNIGDSLEEIYGITCGAVELHAVMTNPEGKTSFNEPSTFLVGFEAENGFITSNELQQIVNWTNVPGPEDLATPVPTSRPKVTPPPTSAPTAEPEVVQEADVASKTSFGLILGGAVILVGVLVGLLFAGKGRKKNRDSSAAIPDVVGIDSDRELTVVDVAGHRKAEDETVYDGPFIGGKHRGGNTGIDALGEFVGRGSKYGATGDEEATVFLGQDAEKTVFLGSNVQGKDLEGQSTKKWGISVAIEEERAGQQVAEPKTLFLSEGDAVVFGRTFPADIVINDGAVSRIHFKLSFDGDSLYISDLETTNGTILNGEKLEKGEERPIRSGDTVQLGTTLLGFSFGERERR